MDFKKILVAMTFICQVLVVWGMDSIPKDKKTQFMKDNGITETEFDAMLAELGADQHYELFNVVTKSKNGNLTMHAFHSKKDYLEFLLYNSGNGSGKLDTGDGAAGSGSGAGTSGGGAGGSGFEVGKGSGQSSGAGAAGSGDGAGTSGGGAGVSGSGSSIPGVGDGTYGNGTEFDASGKPKYVDEIVSTAKDKPKGIGEEGANPDRMAPGATRVVNYDDLTAWHRTGSEAMATIAKGHFEGSKGIVSLNVRDSGDRFFDEDFGGKRSSRQYSVKEFYEKHPWHQIWRENLMSHDFNILGSTLYISVPEFAAAFHFDLAPRIAQDHVVVKDYIQNNGQLSDLLEKRHIKDIVSPFVKTKIKLT